VTRSNMPGAILLIATLGRDIHLLIDTLRFPSKGASR
jgi:hypothetical protein